MTTIREEIVKKLNERFEIILGKEHITPDEKRRYDNLGKEILKLTEKL